MEKETKSREQKIIDEALRRFELCVEAEREIRKEALEDLKFRKGDHWPADIKNARNQDNRPCLTINKMPQFVRKVTNDQKQNKPSIEVNPYDDYADVDTAEVLQGLIRNIENQSDAEQAYDKAFEGAAAGSFGYFRLLTEYSSPDSFELEIKVEMIDNQFKACLDPYHAKVDGSDANYGFIWDSMTKDEFIAEYGKEAYDEHADWDAIEQNYKGWVGQDELRVAEYFYKDFERVKLLLLSDGESYFADSDELPEKNEDGTYTFEYEQMNGLGELEVIEEKLTVIEERWTKRCIVKWIKMNALKILEETEWPSIYIPIIPVYGDCLNIDGEIIRESVIRHARDSQRILNFWASTEAEAITLAPKAPFIGAEGQFKGHENTWKQANVKNYPYLQYKPTTHEGQLLPAPARNAFEPPVMAITNARQLANDDIKATTGIYDASLGAQSNEVSGIAIKRRNTQSETSNFHLVDNLAKSIKHAGRMMVEIIPKIYDKERVIRTLGIDGEKKLVRIQTEDPSLFLEGQKRAYDFSLGKYDVVVSSGPSYETQRQEAREAMLELSAGNSRIAEVASDVIVKNMDFPGSQELSERLKRSMPPEIVGNEDEDQQIPPQVQQAMGQMQQQMQMLQDQLAQANEIIKTDSMKIESNERIAAMKISADLKKEIVKIEGKEDLTVLEAEIKTIENRAEQIGSKEPVLEE